MSEQIFLQYWYSTLEILTYVFSVVTIIDLIAHYVKVATISDLKKRYDYVSGFEIKRFKRLAIWLALVCFFLVNTFGQESIMVVGMAFIVKIFFGFAAGTLIAYVLFLILDYYYPTKLYRRLSKIRNTPRINPATGNTMRLLAEDEEDVHLDEGMQKEENMLSVDYDVWKDEQTGDVSIEKYIGNHIGEKCNNCGYFTMRIFKEEISEHDVMGRPTSLLKHYQCTYCDSLRTTEFKVSKKDLKDLGDTSNTEVEHPKSELIRISITSSVGTTQSYEFKSVEQARQFLNEFDTL